MTTPTTTTLYTTSIEINPNHTYYHPEVGTAFSVNAIIKNGESTTGNNQAMAIGEQIHTLLHHYLTGNTSAVTSLAQELPEDAKTKARALCGEAKKILIKAKDHNYQPLVEQRFIFKEDNLLYGGTPDLILADTIVDWKTGGFYPHYVEQLSAYAYAHGKTNAVVYYFENNTLTKKVFNQQQLQEAYTSFEVKANELNGIMTQNMKDISTGFNKLHELEQNAKQAEKVFLESKQKFADYLKNNGYTRVKIGDYSYTVVEPSTSLSLTKEAKQQLLQDHPEYFTEKPREGFVRFTFPKTQQLTKEA